MIKTLLQDFSIPVAISLTVAVGGLTVNNAREVAVLQTESKNMLELQKEMNTDLKAIGHIVYRIDAKLAVQEKAHE
jgi:hypothetical protein